MKEIQQLREIAVKLHVSGTAIPIAQTRLYQGGFGFVTLRAYVPITQNRSPDTSPLCTVYRATTDAFGNRKQFNKDIYNLFYIGDVEIDGEKYMLFERPLPKDFTDTVGDLEMIFNYSEIQNNMVMSRLVSSIYRTNVDEGGVSDGETVDPVGGELARLNDITVKVEQLEDSVDALLQPPDCTEADQVGIPNVTVKEDGRLKFSELRGADALALQAIIHTNTEPANGISFEAATAQFNRGPAVGESVVVYLEYNGYTYLTRANVYQVADEICSLTISDAPVLITGRKGDEGMAATIRVGQVTTLPFESEATVIIVGTDNAAVFSFGIPKGEGFKIEKVYTSVSEMESDFANPDLLEGDFAIINTGSVEDEDNARLYAKGKTEWVFVTDMSGMQGQPGRDGRDGVNGSDGKDGINGVNGINGKDGVNGSRIYTAQSGDINLSGSWTAYLTQDDYEACIPGDVVVGKNGVMGNILNKYPTNVVAGLNGVNLKGEAAGSGYDLIITSQAEFEEWCTALDAGTCEAHSVLLVGDGGTLEFTRSDGKGLCLPKTLYQVDGINKAKIKVSNFQFSPSYATNANAAAIFYKNALDVTSKVYAINNLEVWCLSSLANMNGSSRAFSRCVNLYNCIGIVRTTGGGSNLCAFDNCDNLINCSAESIHYGYYYCNYLTNCNGKNGGKYYYCHYLNNCEGQAANYVFQKCELLTNCVGIIDTNNNSGTYIHTFSECYALTNCIAKKESGVANNLLSGFTSCYQLVNCVADADNYGAGSESEAYGYYDCRHLSNCKGRARATKSGYVFYNCKYCSSCSSLDIRGDMLDNSNWDTTTAIWGGTNTKRDDDSCEI